MSFDMDLKRLRISSLAVCLCLAAAFLTSCGSSDSSQQPGVTTSATVTSSATLTVTTAAEKAENDDTEATEKTEEMTGGMQTDKKTTTSSAVSDKVTTARSEAVSEISETSDASSMTTHSAGEAQTMKTTTSAAVSKSQTTASSQQTASVATSSAATSSRQTASTVTSSAAAASSQTSSSIVRPQKTPSVAGIDSRQYLLDQMKDTKLRDAAKSAMADMQAGRTEIRISDGVLKESRLSDFIGFISMLEAESYMIPSPYSYTVNKSGYVTGIKVIQYPKTVKQYQNEKAAVGEIAADIVSQAEKTCQTQFDKVLFFHDYIIDNCEYDLDAVNGASAYGCLVEGKAVCEGYAKAMQILCSRAGIECIPVTGHAAYNGNSQSHMWNLINIDGCWTHVDTTWDDIENGAVNVSCYSYFGLTDSEIRIDHMVSENPLISMPKATGISANYYVRKGYYIRSAERIEPVLKKAVDDAVSSRSETVTVRCGSKDIYELAKAAAASGSYEYEYIIDLIKEVKSKHGVAAPTSDGFLIGDCPNAKDTYTIIFFLRY